jgi:tRNA-splicing ligase RtcB
VYKRQVRTLLTGLCGADVEPQKAELAGALYRHIPAGVGSTGRVRLGSREMDDMLGRGAHWAVDAGFGGAADLERTEEGGCMAGADPDKVSEFAKRRQRDEIGTLGSGNHYAEVQEVEEIFDAVAAATFGIAPGDVVLSIHCGSRGLGHQIGTDYLKRMVGAAAQHGIALPDRELACAPISSVVGQDYLGAMRAAINCALANRQVLTHLAREAFAEVFPDAHLRVLYDVSHNTCKVEEHAVEGRRRPLYVHRKGATRALGPGHPALPVALRDVGQPVLIGGSMGTASYILAGNATSEAMSLASACHGAGRTMSRTQATKRWQGREVVRSLESRGILVRSPSLRGIAEEAPGAYMDVSAVVLASERAGLARRVARLRPLVCVKG